jgi:hypothetical protein
MILLTQHDCPFCTPDLLEKVNVMGGKHLRVINHPDGTPYIEDESFVPLPAWVRGLPALIVGKDVYMGVAPIREFLEQHT